jgi:hypothetical protein
MSWFLCCFMGLNKESPGFMHCTSCSMSIATKSHTEPFLKHTMSPTRGTNLAIVACKFDVLLRANP